MKALVWTAVNKIEVRDVPKPRPAAGEALVRVSHAGICGSDLHIWHGEHPRAKPPLVLGHEFSGTIVEAAKGGKLRVGDAVAAYPVLGCGKCELCASGREYICRKLGLIGIDRDGGMAEWVSVPESKLHRLPKGCDMAKAAMAEPAAVAVHDLNRSGFHSGATAAIIGAGPIGACIALAARAAGAKKVLLGDISDFRLGLMRSLGFTAIHTGRESFLQAVRDATEGKGVDFVFEATGIPAAAKDAQALACVDGKLVIVGIFPAPIPVDLRDIVFREITVIGTRHYTPQEFDRAIEMVATGALDVSPLITGVYPIDRAVEAFENAAGGANVEKVLIQLP